MNLEKLLNTPDTTAQFEVKDIEENKFYSLCAYISILFVIPLLVCSASKFARFHTNQGIVLFVLTVVAEIAVAIVSAILGLIPVLGAVLAWAIGMIVNLAMLALMVLGIINSATGKAKELPIVGNIRILK